MERLIVYKDENGLLQVLYRPEDKDLFKRLVTNHNYEFLARFDPDKKYEVEKEIAVLKENASKSPRIITKRLVENLNLKTLIEGGLF